MLGLNISLFMEKLRLLSSFPIVYHCDGVEFIARACLRLCFSFQCVFFHCCSPNVPGSFHLVSGFYFSIGSCFMYSCRLNISVGGGEFRNLLCNCNLVRLILSVFNIGLIPPLSEKAWQIAEEWREMKGKGEKERYIYLNAEFQGIARSNKKHFLRDQLQRNRGKQ